MGVIETCRVFSGWKGNLTENKGSIGISLVLIVPAVLSSVYILAFQSYVLRFMDVLIFKCIFYLLIRLGWK